ncbi:DUF6443 domain-containing protein [Aquimarina aggregata]|uniref:DUF6443 domain-containing protein n=1 Tax=Aquimarina aggregata TaxID=1642818 RepID=UPI00249100DF|nr:DUF6443 domain-containing protein [Aquimarina aggregata]
MKNKIQNYIVLLIVMMSTASAFSQIFGGPGDGNNCNIYSYRDADRDGYGVKSQRICDKDVPDGYSLKFGDRDDNNPLITDLPPKYFYFDKDKDTYGDPNKKVYASRKPNGYVTNNSDYDDNTGLITNIAPRNFYRDYDKDGFGNPGNKVYRSAKPSGYVTDARDCNDGDETVNPNTVWYLDGDNDGYSRSTKKQCTSPGSKYKRSVTGQGDCNDGDATLNPLTVWYYDNDGDSFGNEGDLSTVRQQCSSPGSKYVRKKGDINDNNEYITNIPPKNFYRDGDKDSYGNPNIKYYRSFAPSDGHTYVTNGSDYDDSTGHITNIAPKNFYRDGDKDSYGNPSIKYYRSKAPSDGHSYVTNGSDRDDGNKWITNIAPKNFYRDGDKDTFGNPNIKYYRSVAPNDGHIYVTNGSDCNDGDETVNPNTVWYLDGDNDGYSRSTKKQCTSPGSKYKRSVTGQGDCNDGDATLNPLTVWYYDNDGDSFGNEGDLSTVRQQCSSPGSKYVRKKGDINDNNEYITNIPPKNFYRDGDKDTYGNPNIKYYRSFAPSDGHTYVTNGSDYDDSTGHITNIAPKNFYRDEDKDTFGNPDIKFYRSATPSDGYSYVTNGSDRDDGNEYITNIAPKNFYRDGDKDTFGNPNIKYYRSAAPSDGHDYVTNGSDCNDGDKTVNPDTVWYLDGDDDGYARSTKTQCSSPGVKYKRSVTGMGDCNDNSAIYNPLTLWYYDNDGDGFGDETNLEHVTRQCGSPSAKHVLKGGDIDDNDEFITDIPPKNFYRDVDKDTYGDTTTKTFRSLPPADGNTYVLVGGDCNDNQPELNPDTVWYEDSDKDTFGNNNSTLIQCTQPTGYVRKKGDLDDGNDLITDITPQNFYIDGDNDTFGDPTTKTYRSVPPNNGNTYVTNGNDYDDSTANITDIAPTTFYEDSDNDGFGNPNQSVFYSVQPTGYVTNANDQCPNVYGEYSGCVTKPYNELTISNDNYVFTRTYQNEMVSSTEITLNEDVIESITYFDGLGRPKQQIGIKASPKANDIVTHITYDQYGRQAQQYLPFERETSTITPIGGYAVVDVANTINAYYKNTYGTDFSEMAVADVNAYSESIFEASPLNRVVEQGAPGKDWKADPNSDDDHTIKLDWDVNQIGEVIRYDAVFTENNIEAPTLVENGFYGAGELQITIVKDENWKPSDGNNHTTKEYTDKQGKIVLKRTYNVPVNTSGGSSGATADQIHDTYYVYDDLYGNLTYVIPPKVTIADGVSPIEMNELCYQYKYDYRNRLIEKKIPGKGDEDTWESIVYNKLDQPILTQDPNQKAKGEWLFTKYDALGRVAYTGKLTDTRARSLIQDEAIAYTGDVWVTRGSAIPIGGTTMYYTDGGYPKVTAGETLTINYYDDYEFLGTTSIQELANPGAVSGEAITNRTKSLPTGSKVKVLGEDKWITTVTYYDKKARPIYVAIKNEYLNTTDIVETQLDFVGKVLKTTTKHKKGTNSEIVTVDTFTYDHMGRAKKQTQKIGSQDAEVIAENSYDALGQLSSKKIGGGLQDVKYDYNVRGWLKAINKGTTANGALFGFNIRYNEGNNPLYNGNINSTSWQTANDNVTRSYTYTYDALNRIVTGISNDGRYNLSNVSYDKMGNILSLQRTGAIIENIDPTKPEHFGIMDNLTYKYNFGNKLTKVTELPTGNTAFGFKDGTNTNDDYDYDSNRNMIKDENKGITNITYNHLNLPEIVSISNIEGTGTITYIYDATGAKLKKIAPSGSSLITTEYAGKYVYENGDLRQFSHTEGYVEPSGNGNYNYVYSFLDHLGTVRLTYGDVNGNGSIEPDTEIFQERNAYPFGLEHRGYNNTQNGVESNYMTYLGQEMNKELGLNWLNFRYRNYMPEIGRFFGVDPVSEDYMSISTYQFAHNSPVWKIEIEGLEGEPTSGVDLVNQEPIKNSSRKGMSIGDVIKTIDIGITLGFGKTFGLSGKAFGFELGGSYDGGTTSYSGSIQDEISTQTTEGYSANFFVIGYGNETSTDLTNSPRPLTSSEAGKQTVNEQSFETTQTNTETFTFLFGDATHSTTTTGQASIKGATTITTDHSSGIVNTAKVAGQTSFNTDSDSKTTTSNGGQINIIGFELNVGIRFGIDIHLDVPDNYSNRDPLNSLCFIKGTKINMADNSLKNIENVQVGDYVKTFNEASKKIENNKVLRVDSPFHSNLIKVNFNNGIHNVNTQDHPYYVVGKGWCSFDPDATDIRYEMKVKKLTVGDICLFLINNKLLEVKITDIKITDRSEQTYNLSTIENNHNFFANGILVHNKRKK